MLRCEEASSSKQGQANEWDGRSDGQRADEFENKPHDSTESYQNLEYWRNHNCALYLQKSLNSLPFVYEDIKPATVLVKFNP